MKYFKMISLVRNCILLIILTTSSAHCIAQNTEAKTLSMDTSKVPIQFRAVYQELDESIQNAVQLYPLTNMKACPLFAPELFMAGSGLYILSSDPKNWRDLLATIDAFKLMKMEAVSVMIAAPDLTIGDSTALIAFYQRLISEIHSRGMKLYIEHFDNPPFSPHAHKGWKENPNGKADFLMMREKELSMIYRKIKPDFLSIITEPETMMRWSQLSFSTDELANWVRQISGKLKETKESPTTLLGAGAGVWESDDLVLQLAQCANLDYIDIHMYNLKSTPLTIVSKLDSIIHKIRKINPGMKITIGETWLYKHSVKEVPSMYAETFFRDNFSFWSVLDQNYLKLLMGIAQKENIAVITPYFSQYFFTYYNYGDIDARNLPQWPASVFISWKKALESIHMNQISSTGKEISSILKIPLQ